MTLEHFTRIMSISGDVDMRTKCSFARRVLPIIFLICLIFGGSGKENHINESSALSSHSSSSGSSNPLREADLLTLVNAWNPLNANYNPILVQYDREFSLDRRAFNDFVSLMEDCRSAGCEPYICSAYRPIYKQHELFELKVYRLMKEGMEEALARTTAAREVALPGTSEHQLGLAVDIIDSDYGYLDEAQADTPTQKWLMENSWRYGFILRYPEGKSEITGIIFEPWHYRYVGKEAAEDIYKSGLCLEEWLEEKEKQELLVLSLHQRMPADEWEIVPEIS